MIVFGAVGMRGRAMTFVHHAFFMLEMRVGIFDEEIQGGLNGLQPMPVGEASSNSL